MDVGQLKNDVRAGRCEPERLARRIDVWQRQLLQSQRQLQETQRQLQETQRQLQETQRRLEEARQQIAELEKKLACKAAHKLAEPFSLRAEERRQAARGKLRRKRQPSGRRGRVTTAEKVRQAGRTEKCFPAGVPESECRLSHTRPVWRLEDGRAVLVAYQIHRHASGKYGKIAGVLGRSEFGLEIVIAISFQVRQVGLSFDQVCLLMGFLLKLNLKKSQVDALLTRLARHWEGEFERLCALLAHSAVVHAYEKDHRIKLLGILSVYARINGCIQFLNKLEREQQVRIPPIV